MRVHYLSHDEVNAAEARHIVEQRGLSVEVIDVRDTSDQLTTNHMVCDLDHLPREYRTELVSRAIEGQEFRWITVHSYNLSPKEIRVLRGAGVGVFRYLRTAVLSRMRALTASGGE